MGLVHEECGGRWERVHLHGRDPMERIMEDTIAIGRRLEGIHTWLYRGQGHGKEDHLNLTN
jgi:hypothetical protein